MKSNNYGHLAFYLFRKEDESQVSGTGVVAEGCQFNDGQCVLCWLRETEKGKGSIGTYTNMEQLIRIHGHNGKTTVHWHT